MAEGKRVFDMLASAHDSFESDETNLLTGLYVTIRIKGKDDIDLFTIQTLDQITELTGVLLTCLQVTKQHYLNQIERGLENFEPEVSNLHYSQQTLLPIYHVSSTMECI